MKEFRSITNREEVVSELADILQEFDKTLSDFQNDVYMYFDEETGIATLDTFANPGGNSFLKGSCIRLYSHRSNGCSIYDHIEDTIDFAHSLDMDLDVLFSETVQYLIDTNWLDEEDRDEYKPDYSDIYDYVSSREDYVDKITAAYQRSIDEERSEYCDQAEWLIAQAEENLSECFYE